MDRQPGTMPWNTTNRKEELKELLSKTDDEEATPEGELEAIATPAMEELAILSRMEAFMKEMWRLVELIAKIVTNLVSLEVQKVSGKHPPPCKGPSSDQVAILLPVTRVSANHPVAAKMVYQSERFPVRPSQLLPHLLAAGMITLPTPPMKNPTPRILNSSPRCDFHSGMIGHATDQCYTLQHQIQNLLSQNLLAFEQKPVEPTEPAKATECASSIDEVPPWFYSTLLQRKKNPVSISPVQSHSSRASSSLNCSRPLEPIQMNI